MAVGVAAAIALAGCGGKEDPGPGGIVTEPFRYMETDRTLAGIDLETSAPDYVRALADRMDLGLSAADGFDIRSISSGSRDGLRHVRMRQIHGGVVVRGSEVVVHADDTTFLGANGTLTRNLDGFDTGPTLSASDALAIARQDRSGGDASVSFPHERSELVILPGKAGGAHLAWHLQIGNTRSGSLDAGMWDYFVDAGDGAVLDRFDGLPRAEQASGPGGPEAGSWVSELDVEQVPADRRGEAGGEYWLSTDRLATFDMAVSEEVPVAGDLDWIDNVLANDAHGFSEVTLDYLREWYGYESLDDAGVIIESYVNDTTVCPESSAACAPIDGEARAYYRGTYSQLLTVVAHENAHGFTELHSNLTYQGQGADLHEGFSMVAEAIAEYYHHGASPTAISKLCNPEVGHVDDIEDGQGGIGIPMKAFCLSMSRYVATGSSHVDAAREMGRIWYHANAAYWTPSTDFVTACQGTIDAAHSLGFSSAVVQGLRDSWADVGVECAGADSFVCDLDDSCDVEAGETCASCPDDCGACSEDCSWWKKAKCKIGIGDCSRCDAVPSCGDGVCDGDETDGTCGQDCGCAASDSCTVAPFGCYCDESCLDVGDCCADVANFCG